MTLNEVLCIIYLTYERVRRMIYLAQLLYTFAPVFATINAAYSYTALFFAAIATSSLVRFMRFNCLWSWAV